MWNLPTAAGLEGEGGRQNPTAQVLKLRYGRSASSSFIWGVAELAKIANVQYSEVFVFRPEGAQQESPGQRPGWQVNHDFQALKGRNTL